MRSPSAILRAIGPDGREHDVRIDGTPLTIGRASDNGFTIDDAKVSRHHARLRATDARPDRPRLHERRPGQRVRAARWRSGGGRIEIRHGLVVEAVSAD